MGSKIFDKLEQDIIKYRNLGKIIIFGDTNAHINKHDMDLIENEMNDILDDSLPDNYIADNVHLMRNTQINQTTKYSWPMHKLTAKNPWWLNPKWLWWKGHSLRLYTVMVFPLTIIAFVAHHYFNIF